MKKTRTKTTQPTGRYKVGDEFIYHNGKNLMDKVTIQEIIPGGYLLSNQVKMNESLVRIDVDAKKFNHTILPLTEDTEILYEAYWAHAQLLRRLADLQKELMQKNPFQGDREYQEKLIKVNKKLKKL